MRHAQGQGEFDVIAESYKKWHDFVTRFRNAEYLGMNTYAWDSAIIGRIDPKTEQYAERVYFFRYENGATSVAEGTFVDTYAFVQQVKLLKQLTQPLKTIINVMKSRVIDLGALGQNLRELEQAMSKLSDVIKIFDEALELLKDDESVYNEVRKRKMHAIGTRAEIADLIFALEKEMVK